MSRNLHTVLHYFGYFSYAPSIDEIYIFYPTKIGKNSLQKLLTDELKDNKIVRLQSKMHFSLIQGSKNNQSPISNHSVYTLPQYSIPYSPCHSHEGGRSPRLRGNPGYKFQYKKSNYRLDPLLRGDDNTRRIQIYINILKRLPFVRFVGVTGATAMRGTQENDDTDLCIVAKHNLLWTTRFVVVVLAKILGIHNQTGVCLNLFFDELDLYIAPKKQNMYIAHELLQMKSVIDKEHTYSRFLEKNEWTYRYFPNAKQRVILGTPTIRRRTPGSRFWMRSQFSLTRMTILQLHKFVDHFFKSIQLPRIRQNRADFLITNSQLWLFKNDFEKNLRRSRLLK